MPRTSAEQRLFDELLTRYGREIATAFLKASADLKRGADLQRVIAAVASGDIAAAIAALHLDAAAYGPLLDAMQAAYGAGGNGAAQFFPTFRADDGTVMVVRFNLRNVRAEAWVRDHSSSLVTRILEDQRTAIREQLTAGLNRGENPTTTALGLVGRVNPVSKVREGGIVGLTAQQAGFVRNARDELRSGDPAQLTHYLTRAQRDRRFDGSVKRAIAGKAPLTAATAEAAVRNYSNRLLRLRGRGIGRTEALTALRAAKHEAYLQAVERGAVAESAIRRTWRDVGDLRVRHTHAKLDGDTVALREPFRSPSGARLMYPGDTSLGAPASETVNCRCDVDYRVDFLANIR